MMIKFKELDNITKAAIIFIIIGTLLRFGIAIAHHPSGDSCWYLQVSRYIARNNEIPVFHHFVKPEFSKPPLFTIIAAIFYKFFGMFSIGDLGMKLAAPLISSLILVFTFLTAHLLFNKKIALYSLIFITFVPISLQHTSFSFLDGAVSLFSLIAIYSALKRKYYISGFFIGLAMLSQFNGALTIIPIFYILYLDLRRDKINGFKFGQIVLIMILIAFLIGLPIYVRNYHLFGNPFYPYFSPVLGGKITEMEGLESVNYFNLVNPEKLLIPTYLGLYGVPNSNINTLYFYESNFLKFALIFWLIGTILFSIPFLFIKKRNHLLFLLIWILAYVPAFLAIVTQAWALVRLMLPAFPAIAILWAIGLEKIEKTSKKYFNIVLAVLLIIILGFIASIFIKTYLANSSWDNYSKDFEWIKKNTPNDSVFVSNQYCLPYNIDKDVYAYRSMDQLENEKGKKIYILTNPSINIDYKTPDYLIDKFNRTYNIIYHNPLTQNTLYAYN